MYGSHQIADEYMRINFLRVVFGYQANNLKSGAIYLLGSYHVLQIPGLKQDNLYSSPELVWKYNN